MEPNATTLRRGYTRVLPKDRSSPFRPCLSLKINWIGIVVSMRSFLFFCLTGGFGSSFSRASDAFLCHRNVYLSMRINFPA